MKKIVLYNGADFCASCDRCPVVEYFMAQKIVKISDPAKPAKGEFIMTVDEYNALLDGARRI